MGVKNDMLGVFFLCLGFDFVFWRVGVFVGFFFLGGGVQHLLFAAKS